MKKKLLLALAILLGGIGFAKADVLANAQYFPDETFLSWVLNHFKKIRGSRLTDEELASVKSIVTLDNSGLKTNIHSLKGIEYFTELETLSIYNGDEDYVRNTIEYVDLSKNKKLKAFYFISGDRAVFHYGNPFYGNTLPLTPCYGYFTPKAPASRVSSKDAADAVRLKRVNLANLPELRDVDIEGHALTGLDLRGCPNLRTVIVHDSKNAVNIKLDTCANLETFGYSQCEAGVQLPDFALMPNLKALLCDDGKITNLDFSSVAKSLEVLSCANNDIQSLDLSKCTKLKSLNCEKLPITSLDCSQLDSIKYINVSSCTSLQTFPTLPSCITTIACDYVKAFAKADLSQYQNLMYLRAEECGMTSFDGSKHPNLVFLNLTNNNIAAMNLSGLKMDTYEKWYRVKQRIYVDAIPVPDRSNYWRLILPDDVDLNKINPYNLEPSDQGKKLYVEYYEDGQGNLKPSLVTNTNVGTDYRYCGIYQYLTGGIGKSVYNGIRHTNEILSDVTIYAKIGTSGIDDIAAPKDVEDVKYFNLQGHESTEPFSGFNIKVTHYTDGSSESKKVIK